MRYSTTTTLLLLIIRIIKCFLKNGIVVKALKKNLDNRGKSCWLLVPEVKFPVFFPQTVRGDVYE